MPSLHLRWPSLLLPLGLFAIIAAIIVTVRSPALWTAQTVTAYCGNSVVDAGETCMEPGLGTCSESQECIQCRCTTPNKSFRCGNVYGRTGGCTPTRAGMTCMIECRNNRLIAGKCDANKNCYGYCGDGKVDLGELCDTGDILNSEACTEFCTIRSGWTCTGSPSRCTLTPAAASSSAAAASSALANRKDIVLDNNDLGFMSYSGTWSVSSVGYKGAQHVHATGPSDWNRPLEWGGWSINRVPVGSYGMYATWEPSSQYSKKVTLEIDRSRGLVSVPSENNRWTRATINQQNSPTASWTCNGRKWRYFGNLTITKDYNYVGVFMYTENGAPRNSRFAMDGFILSPSDRKPVCAVPQSSSSSQVSSSSSQSSSSSSQSSSSSVSSDPCEGGRCALECPCGSIDCGCICLPCSSSSSSSSQSSLFCATTGKLVYVSPSMGPTTCCSQFDSIKRLSWFAGNRCYSPINSVIGTCVRGWDEICGNGSCDTNDEDQCTCPEDCHGSAPSCGDGQVVSPEQCDDGNQWTDDGCSHPDCQVESGWICSGSPSQCTRIASSSSSARPVCGNGIREGSEECDNGSANGLNFSCGRDCMMCIAPPPCPTGTHGSGGGIDARGCATGGQCIPNEAVCGNGIREGSEQCEVGITCPPINCFTTPCPQQQCDFATCSCSFTCPDPTPPICAGGVLFPQLGTDENGCKRPPVCCEGAASGGECTTNMNCTNGKCVVESCTCGYLCPDPTPPICAGGVLFPQLGLDENGCKRPPVCCEGAASGGECTMNMNCAGGRCIVESCTCGHGVASASSQPLQVSSMSSVSGQLYPDIIYTGNVIPQPKLKLSIEGPTYGPVDTPFTLTAIVENTGDLFDKSTEMTLSWIMSKPEILSFPPTCTRSYPSGGISGYPVYFTCPVPAITPSTPGKKVSFPFTFQLDRSRFTSAIAKACVDPTSMIFELKPIIIRQRTPGGNIINHQMGGQKVPLLYTHRCDSSSSSRVLAVCGNGIMEQPEWCDDGNTATGDGCYRCLTQGGFSCTKVYGQRSICTRTQCGNGVVDSGEVCDDGNVVGNDGCGGDCKVEYGFSCVIYKDQPSRCSRGTCGNGRWDLYEDCDDGNKSSSDGCSAACKYEAGWICTGYPSRCSRNGISPPKTTH
ncbi:MAG: DUF4215 domain-containing protein [Candidatus Peregrinibacteria bacterium]